MVSWHEEDDYLILKMEVGIQKGHPNDEFVAVV